jgi:sulfur carrier protein
MIVNGNDMICEPEITLSNMLEKLNLDEDKVVVEINLEIVSRKSYKNLFLNEEDKIEIVSFVGGG